MKSHQQFLEELYSTNNNVLVVGEYIGALKPIKVKCKMCDHIWEAQANNLLNGSNCPKCHRKPKEISNSILFTHPTFANMLYDKENAKRYSFGSHKKLDWICPICGEIVKSISIEKVISRKHIPCKKCSDGISYPNKYMYSLLKQLNVNFIPEYSPDWIFPKRYDFYIPDHNLIIEMYGAIGHGGKTFTGEDGKTLYQVDLYKDKIAKCNGLKVIRIDCSVSDSDYISNNVINSDLSNVFDLSKVNWVKCDHEALSSIKKKVINLWNTGKSIEDILNETNLSRITVVGYLQSGNKYGWCDYDTKSQQKDSGNKNIAFAYDKNKKPILCLNNMKKFKFLKEANIWAGLSENSHSISDNCNGKTKTAGKHPVTKERLHWSFLNKNL